MTDENAAPEPSDEFWENLIANIFKIWVIPEVERRRATSATGDFQFRAAQVVMELGVPPEVRLNNEVRGTVVLDDPDQFSNPVDIEDFHLLAPHMRGFHLEMDDRPNAAHITAVHHSGGWFVDFDLRYNGERVFEQLLASREFLDSAAADLENARLRPFAASLFTAMELLATAKLLAHPIGEIANTKKHTHIIQQINREGSRGNIGREVTAGLNELFRLRNPARYVNQEFQLTPDRARDLLAIAEAFFETLVNTAPTRTRLKLARQQHGAEDRGTAHSA
jgi:uncharacterized protein (UPF0332 family)